MQRVRQNSTSLDQDQWSKITQSVVSFAAVFWDVTPPKKRLLTTEPHSFTIISQSQLRFHFQKPVRAKFVL